MEERKQTWPVKIRITKPTPENPKGTTQMFYAHEWEAYQKSLPPEERDPKFVDSPTEPTAESAAEPAPDTLDPAPSDQSAHSASTALDEGNNLSSDARGTPSSASPASSASCTSSLPPDYDRHRRRCCICSHPDRDAIEGDFIRWRSPGNIAKNYKIANPSSLYRHAHSTGLFARRRREFSRVLEDILEMVEESTLDETADVIIRAARLYSRLDENGNWVEPSRTHIILTGPAPGQLVDNPDLEISAEPPGRPRQIPFKLASRLTEQEKVKKNLIATHPSSENGPNS
jgi:hypothetical protein